MEKHCENGVLKHREAAVRQVDSERRVIDFVASTEEPDRDLETVVTRGIDLAAYSRNPTLLLDHDRRVPLGRVVGLGVERLGAHDALVGTAEILPAGTSQRADEAWGEIRAGARNGISIAFIAVDADPPGTPRRVIRRSELLEISSVTMPACRACVVTGASGAKALTDQPALAASVQETLRRGEQLEAKLLAAEFERLSESAKESAARPFKYVFLSKGERPEIERAAARFVAWACEPLRVSLPEVRLFREAGTGESPGFRMDCKVIGACFPFPDYTIAVDGSLGPELLAETVAHEIAHANGADEREAEAFARKFLATVYREMAGSGTPRAGRPMPGMTQDQTPVIVSYQPIS